MKNYFPGFLFGLLMLPVCAFAALTNGTVESVDTATRKITLSTVDPATGRSVRSDIWVQSNAVYSGVSLETLKPGDTVWLETSTDSEGNLRAAKVTKG